MFIDNTTDFGYSKRYTVYEKATGRIALNTDSFQEASSFIRKNSHKTCTKYTLYDKQLRTFCPNRIRSAAENNTR